MSFSFPTSGGGGAPGSNSVGAAQLVAGARYRRFATGRNGAGNITLTGLKAGDVLDSATIFGNPGAGSANTITTSFTATIAADNTLAQTSATDYSATGIYFEFIAKGGGA